MKRREFISLIAAATACPLGARAQQPMRRIGLLMNGDETDSEWKGWLAAFRQRLRGLGWVEGQNLKIDMRSSVGDPDHARTAVTELLRLSPEVIFSSGTAS